MDGGAWPFLVGGVICLVNSDNERDSPLLTSRLDLDVFIDVAVSRVPSKPCVFGGISHGAVCVCVLLSAWACASTRGCFRA